MRTNVTLRTFLAERVDVLDDRDQVLPLVVHAHAPFPFVPAVSACRRALRRCRNRSSASGSRGTSSRNRSRTSTSSEDQWLEDARNGHARNRSGDPYKPSAIRGYEQNLRKRVIPALGTMRLSEVRPRDLQALVDRLDREGVSPSTIDTTITPLKAIYRRARNRGLVNHNPTQGLEKPAVRSKPRRFASASEAEALLAVLDGPQRALWATAFYAGLGRGPQVTVTGTVTRTPAVSCAWAGRLIVTAAAPAGATTMSTPTTVRARAARRTDANITPSLT